MVEVAVAGGGGGGVVAGQVDVVQRADREYFLVVAQGQQAGGEADAYCCGRYVQRTCC